MGASALRQRQSYMLLIDGVWSPGWFDGIPRSIRPPAWNRPEDLPRDVLFQITADAKLAASCCHSCRILVLRALASLEADLVPCVRGLEQVAQHTSGGDEIRPSQTLESRSLLGRDCYRIAVGTNCY
jgi:hypothetical protein